MIVACAIGCGGGETAKSPIVFIPEPTTADAGAADHAAPVAASAPPTEAPGESARPSGANGPRDANGIIGDAGDLAPATADAVMLVNMAEMRAHPKGLDLARPLVASFAAWPQFVPFDIVHPIRDVDWVLVAGSPQLGAAGQNVILTRYELDDKRADVATRELEKRLSGKRLDLKIAQTTAIAATVDGAERAYVRAKPNVLAIVPKDDAKAAAELLRRVSVPASVRKGELIRIAFTKLPSRLSHVVPLTLGPSRVWVDADGANFALNAESECADEDAASNMAEQIRVALHSVRGLAAMAARPLLAGAKVWSDGKVARYRAIVDDTLLGLLSMSVCGSDVNCGLPR